MRSFSIHDRAASRQAQRDYDNRSEPEEPEEISGDREASSEALAPHGRGAPSTAPRHVRPDFRTLELRDKARIDAGIDNIPEPRED
jgi:hypothetical protein